MANNQINFNINFKTNTSGLKQARDAMDQLLNISGKEVELFNPQAMGRGVQMIREAQTAANQLEMAMTSAYNVKLGTVNLERFNQELQNNGVTLQQLREKMIQVGPAGEQTFAKMASGLMSVKYETVQTTTLLDRLGQSLQRSIMTFASINIINKVKGSIGEAYGYVKNLDTSLNEIRIVTGKSADEMDRFAEKANKAAASLGKATTDYTKASTIFYQQGLSDQDVLARTETTMKVSNTTGTDTKAVADNLTALWNGFNVGAEDAEKAVDVVAAVAAKTASNLDEMTTAMSKVASMANSMGVSEEQLAAQISTVIAVTRQAPESVGTAFKTIYARIADIKAGSEDAEISLGNYSGQLAALGINVLDTSGQLKDMGDIIEEVGSSWGNYSKEQQVAIAGIMGGQRQVNQLRALFDNWDKYTDTMKVAADAQGTLQQQQDTYMESAEGQLQKLRTEWEGILDSLLSSDDIIKVAKSIQPVLVSIEKMIDAFGGGIGILQKFSPLLLQIVSPQIAQSIGKIANSFEAARTNTQLAKQQVEIWNNTLKDTQFSDKYSQSIQQIRGEYVRLINTMSAEERNSFEESMNRFVNVTGPQVEQNLKEIENEFQVLQQQGLNTDFIPINAADDIQTVENKLKNLKDVALNFPELNFTNKKGKFYSGNIFNTKDWAKANEELNKLKNLYGDQLPEAVQKFQNAITDVNANATKGNVEKLKIAYQELKNDGLRGSTEELEKFKQKIKDYIVSLQNAEQQQDKFNTKLKQLSTQQVAQSFTSIAQGIVSVVSAAQSLINLGSIWNNDDLSTGEKLAQTLTTIGSIIAVTIPSIKSMITAYKTLTSVEGLETVATLANNAAEALGLVSKKANTIATEENTHAIDDNTRAQGTNAVGQGAAATAQTAHTTTTVANTAAQKASNAAMTGGTVAAKGLTAGFKGLLTAISPLLVPLAILGVGIVAIGAAWKATHQNHEEAANKALEKIDEQIQKIEKLKTTMEEYQKITSDMSSMIKGTEEYNKALDEQQEKIKELIKEHGNLRAAITYDSQGNMQLDENEANKIFKKEEENVNREKRNAIGKKLVDSQGKLTDINTKDMSTQEFLNYNKVAIKEYVDTISEYEDVEDQVILALISRWQAEGREANDIASAFLVNSKNTLEELEKLEKSVKNFQKLELNGQKIGGFDYISVLNGDTSSISKLEAQSILNMSNEDLAKKLGVEIDEAGQWLKDVSDFKAKMAGVVNDFNELPLQFQDNWKNIDSGIIEKFINDTGKINNEILSNLGTGLEEIKESGIDLEQFISDLNNIDWRQGTAALEDFRQKYKELPSAVEEYIKEQVKLNTVVNSSTTNMQNLVDAMSKISTLKFGDTLSDKDYGELISKFKGLEKYFVKIGDKYTYMAKSGVTANKEIKKAFDEQIQKFKSYSELVKKANIDYTGAAEVINNTGGDLGNGVVRSSNNKVNSINQSILQNQDLINKLSEETQISIGDLETLLGTAAENLSDDQKIQLKAIYEELDKIKNWSISSADSIELQKEYIAAVITSEEELNQAIIDGKISAEAAYEMRAYVKEKELEITEKLKKAEEELNKARIEGDRKKKQDEISKQEEIMQTAVGEEYNKALAERNRLREEDKELARKAYDIDEKKLNNLKEENTIRQKLKDKGIKSDIIDNSSNAAVIASSAGYNQVIDRIVKDIESGVKNGIDKDQLIEDYGLNDEEAQIILDIIKEIVDQTNIVEDENRELENLYHEQAVSAKEILEATQKQTNELAIQKNQRELSKINDQLSHASGDQYLALQQQRIAKEQEYTGLLQQQLNWTNQEIEQRKAMVLDIEKGVSLDAAGNVVIAKGVELNNDQLNIIQNYNSARKESINIEYQIEDIHKQQYLTISKIADEQRAIANNQREITRLEEAAEHLSGDALLKNLEEQRKLREKNIQLQSQQLSQQKEELKNAQKVLETSKLEGQRDKNGNILSAGTTLTDYLASQGVAIQYDESNGVKNMEAILDAVDGTSFAEDVQNWINNINDAADATEELKNQFDDLINSIATDEENDLKNIEEKRKTDQETIRQKGKNSVEGQSAMNDLAELDKQEKNIYQDKSSYYNKLLEGDSGYWNNIEEKRENIEDPEIKKLAAKITRDEETKRLDNVNDLLDAIREKGENATEAEKDLLLALDIYEDTNELRIEMDQKIADLENKSVPDYIDPVKAALEESDKRISSAKEELSEIDRQMETATEEEYSKLIDERIEKEEYINKLYEDRNTLINNAYNDYIERFNNSAKNNLLISSIDNAGIVGANEERIDFDWSKETGELLNREDFYKKLGYKNDEGEWIVSQSDIDILDEWLNSLEEVQKASAKLNDEQKKTRLPKQKFEEYTIAIKNLEKEQLALQKAQQRLTAEMQKTSTQMSKLQDDASWLTGDDLVANLEAQISCLEKQQALGAERISQAKEEEALAKKKLEIESQKKTEAENILKSDEAFGGLKKYLESLLKDYSGSVEDFFDSNGNVLENKLRDALGIKDESQIKQLVAFLQKYKQALKDLEDSDKAVTQAEQAYATAMNNTNQQLTEQDKLNNQILQKQQEIAKEKLKTAEAAIKRETSAQHGLSKELKDVEKTIKKIQKEQNELTGPALIAKIQEEIAAQEKKKQILEKQLRLMIEQLKAMAQLYSMHIQEQYGIGVGFQVDETGVSNLDELYSALEGVSSKLRKAATEDITNFISQLNSMASSVSSAQDAIDDLSDSIEDLQKKEKETAEDEAFRVKEEAWQREEIILKRINKELSHLQSLASHLWGTALINNLERQQSLLQQQAAAEQSKLSSMRQQLQVMAAMLAARGAMVSDGVVENYAEVYASGDQKLIQLISSYQSLYNSIIDLEQSIQDSSDKIFDIEFQKAAERLNMFKTKIDIELDLTKATRQWENFKREFLNTLNRLEDLNDSIYEKSKQAVKDIVSISNTDVGMLTSTVNTIIGEINLMKGGGFSSLYGWDQKAAMDDLGNYRQQLQDALSEVHEKTKQVYDSYIEQMQKIANAFSEQQDSFSKIQSIIEHDMNLIKILKGAESYDALANYYDKSTRNYELQIQKLRDQVDFWKNIMDNAEVGSKKWEEAQKNWQAAIASLNSTVDAALENLVEKYDNLIKKVINDFKKEMTGGEDLNWIKEKWDMQNKEADLYLDKITKEYNIQKLQYNYQKEIDKLNNPTQRQKLLKIMNEEVNKLKEKDKLTKYDVDRANKVYQLKMKQFEMENAQNNKTKMRLRRDAEGNYRYEYVADENKIQELKQDILDLEEEIRQFDISQIKTQKEKYIAEMEDFYNKVDELTKQKQDGLIDEAEWERRVEVLKNHFLEMTGGISDIIDTSKDNLIDSTTTEMLDLTMITEDALNEMSKEAIETMVDEITPQYEDSVDRLTEKFSEYAEITESLVETLKDVFRDYDNEIQQVGLSAGVSFETVVAGIDQTIDETYNLIDAQDGLIDKYEQELDAIDRLISELQGLEDQYRAVYEAAMDAVNAALKMRMGDTSPDGGGSSGSGGLGSSSSSSGGNNSGDTSKSPEDKKKERAAELLDMSGGDRVYVDTKSDEWYIFDTYSDGYDRYRLIHRKNSIFSTAFQEGFIFGGGTKQEMEKLLADVSKNGSAEAKKRGTIAKFDTGGYTGKWGTEGKIAMLHEKELILNQNDTANILDAVKYSRSVFSQNINVVSVLTSIERTVQGIYEAILNEASGALLSAAAASTSINNQSSNITNTINANFPNAGNMNEIQNALMNLPNYTSQKLYTNSRIK